MGHLLRPRFGLQRTLDFSIVALALGCGFTGYYWNQNEDEATKKDRLRREQARRAEERKRKLDQLNSISKLYEEKIEIFSQKRQELLDLRKKMESLSVKLQRRHKELESEIEELRRLVEVKEELQARSRALDGSAPENDDSVQSFLAKKNDDSVQS